MHRPALSSLCIVVHGPGLCGCRLNHNGQRRGRLALQEPQMAVNQPIGKQIGKEAAGGDVDEEAEGRTNKRAGAGRGRGPQRLIRSWIGSDATPRRVPLQRKSAISL